jgi:hypothetical protein
MSRTLIKLLHFLNKKPYLISGGFESLIHPVADYLEIPRKNCFLAVQTSNFFEMSVVVIYQASYIIKDYGERRI